MLGRESILGVGREGVKRMGRGLRTMYANERLNQSRILEEVVSAYMRSGSTMPKSTCGNGGRMGGMVPDVEVEEMIDGLSDTIEEVGVKEYKFARAILN